MHVPEDSLPEALIAPAFTPQQLWSEPTVKLGVMASGSGTNFEALLGAIANGELNAQIPVLIYNNPQAKVKAKAERHGIPTVLLNHRDYVSREALDQAIIEVFKSYGVEWVVMAGWMRIVTKVLLTAFPERVINIHPSLLPSFRGAHAIEQALEERVRLTGCTVHLVQEKVDSGPILIQSAVPVLPDDNRETLHARIQKQEHRILPLAIALAIRQSRQDKS